MQLIRELNRPAPVAAARPTAQLQLCARHANPETESEHPRRKPLHRSIQTLCPNRTYILLLLLLLLLIPLFLLLRLPLPADWTRACGRGVESCIIVLDNDLNTQQCVDNHLLNHHAMARGRFDRCHAINSRTQQTRACGRGKAYSSVAIMSSARKPRGRIQSTRDDSYGVDTDTHCPRRARQETQAISRARGCDIESHRNQTTRKHVCAGLSVAHARNATGTQHSLHRARGCGSGALEPKERVGYVRTEQSIERGGA